MLSNERVTLMRVLKKCNNFALQKKKVFDVRILKKCVNVDLTDSGILHETFVVPLVKSQRYIIYFLRRRVPHLF